MLGDALGGAVGVLDGEATPALARPCLPAAATSMRFFSALVKSERHLARRRRTRFVSTAFAKCLACINAVINVLMPVLMPLGTMKHYQITIDK